MPKRIKILYTIPNFDTAGSGKVVYDLIKGLDKHMFEPEICCFHNKGQYFKTIQELEVKIHLFQFATPYRPYITFPFRVFKIYKYFKRHRFDIIHSWHWSSDISEPLAAKLAGIPFVYTKKAMGWGNKFWEWRSKLSTSIIAVNNEMMSQFFSNMKGKTKQIPLGVDVDYFRPMTKSFITPEGVSIAKSDFVIVSVANLVPVKGIEILLQAVNQLQDDSIKVFIIGDDSSNYANNLKIGSKSKNIYFLGKKMDVRPYLALADVFIIPTREKGEGFPIALIEAMSSQRIVLGSQVSGINDILRDFPNQLFEAGNTEELIKKLMWLKTIEENEFNALSRKQRIHVSKSYSLERFISNYDLLYQYLVRNIE